MSEPNPSLPASCHVSPATARPYTPNTTTNNNTEPRWTMAFKSASYFVPKCITRTTRTLFSTGSNSRDNVKIVVAMSGGVDSSVAAYLLQNMSDKSVTVSGLHMSNWNALDEDVVEPTSSRSKSDSNSNSNHGRSNGTFCEASEKEYNDSQSVARHLSIPLHRVSFASEYWIQVFEPFIQSFSSSLDTLNEDVCQESTTPNPDFSCNTYIKFGAMKDYAVNRLGADFIATGHYAQVWHRGYDYSDSRYSQSGLFEWVKQRSMNLEQQVHEAIAGRPEEEWLLNNIIQLEHHSHPPMLLAGADRSKDQTYFLSGVTSDNFRNVIFPLGHLAKKQMLSSENKPNDQQSVREIALQAKIPTASKKDSMGICFIGKRNFGQFVSQYLAETPIPGHFVDIDTGEIVGQHQGALHYTIGQGAKISGAPIKYFVCGKGSADESNIVFVCNDTHHPSLYSDELLVDFGSFNWIGLGGKRNGSSFCHVPIPLVEGHTIELLARTRHLQPLVPCSVTWHKQYNGYNNNALGVLSVKFHKPMRAITPGQILALYAGADGLICLGGGPIHSRGQSYMERGLNISLSVLHPSGHNDLSLHSRSIRECQL